LDSIVNYLWCVKGINMFAKTDGIESVRISHTNKRYSAKTKLKAVTEYLDCKGSQLEICRRYHISDTKVFRRWISCYNSGKDFKERTRSERGITMNKGRKTTQEEITQIVAFCIENGKDYGLTMEKYGVSYSESILMLYRDVSVDSNGVQYFN